MKIPLFVMNIKIKKIIVIFLFLEKESQSLKSATLFKSVLTPLKSVKMSVHVEMSALERLEVNSKIAISGLLGRPNTHTKIQVQIMYADQYAIATQASYQINNIYTKFIWRSAHFCVQTIAPEPLFVLYE